MAEQLPALSSYLKYHQVITHKQHSRGWIESPEGIFFKPSLTQKPRKKRRLKKSLSHQFLKRILNASTFRASNETT